jgi:hypothetical protein
MNAGHRHAGFLAAAAMATALTVPAVPAAATGAQIEAGTLATWADLSTWTRPAAGVPGGIEVGLGLVLAGPDGDMRLAFYAVRPAAPGVQADRPPSEIGVRAAASARMNPNLLRTPTLTLTFGGPEREDQTIDLSATMAVNDPAPGAFVTSGIATMTADTFLQLTAADEIAASVFGAAVALRDDQVEAVRAFRDHLFR